MATKRALINMIQPIAVNPSQSQENHCILKAGNVIIKSFCSPEDIRQYDFSPRFGSHANYRSLYTHRHSLENNAAQPDANVTFALADNQLIVGFGVLTYPDPDERWAQLQPQIMMELKAIEVSKNWRSK